MDKVGKAWLLEFWILNPFLDNLCERSHCSKMPEMLGKYKRELQKWLTRYCWNVPKHRGVYMLIGVRKSQELWTFNESKKQY